MAKQTVDPLGCEVRALEEGLKCWSNGDGTFRVRSSSRPALWWTVEIAAVKASEGWRLKAGCTCESGRARPGQFVACLHGAVVLRSLERRGLATWVGGCWAPSPELMREAS